MRTVVLITGASRGFGRCLAVDFTRELQCEDVDLVCVSVLGCFIGAALIDSTGCCCSICGLAMQRI